MSKFRKALVNNKGFTLIELLVVIAVLGILAAIAIPRLGGVTDKARLSEAQSAIGSIKNALEMTYAENSSYAPADTGGNWKSGSDLLTDTDIGEYVDKISDNWEYYIDADASSYLVEVKGNNTTPYDNTLQATLSSTDTSISTTTQGNLVSN